MSRQPHNLFMMEIKQTDNNGTKSSRGIILVANLLYKMWRTKFKMEIKQTDNNGAKSLTWSKKILGIILWSIVVENVKDKRSTVHSTSKTGWTNMLCHCSDGMILCLCLCNAPGAATSHKVTHPSITPTCLTISIFFFKLTTNSTLKRVTIITFEFKRIVTSYTPYHLFNVGQFIYKGGEYSPS